MQKLRYILIPFSILYGAIIFIRNRFYDWGVFSSWRSEKTFTICVGNLEVGGTGKTPTIEYLIEFLKSKNLKIATLSRGYGRTSKGFKWVETTSLAKEVGDEPLQFKRKHPDITVSVCESRVEGVKRLEEDFDVVLLDDAFQHRALTPHFSILLFDYHSVLKAPWVFPVGNYRDNWGEKKRADVLLVSKCPESVDIEEKKRIEQKLQSSSKKPLYFTQVNYLEVFMINTTQERSAQEHMTQDGISHSKKSIDNFDSVIIVSGIAKPQPFISHIRKRFSDYQTFIFPDHYNFKDADLEKIIQVYEKKAANNPILLCTEKDAQRLKDFQKTFLEEVNWGFIPIRMGIQDDKSTLFLQKIELALAKWQKSKLKN